MSPLSLSVYTVFLFLSRCPGPRYLVDGNGRAHCGPHIAVSTGQTVVGEMANVGNNTWKVTAIAVGQNGGANQTSTYTGALGNVTIDAAYLTLEGMVIYSCQAYPAGGGTKFRDIVLETATGPSRGALQWTPELRHTDCGQKVTVNSPSGDAVTLVYNSTL